MHHHITNVKWRSHAKPHETQSYALYYNTNIYNGLLLAKYEPHSIQSILAHNNSANYNYFNLITNNHLYVNQSEYSHFHAKLLVYYTQKDS